MDQGHDTATQATTVAPPQIPIGDRGEWLRDAALALGVSERAADEFAQSGCMQLGDIGLLAHPMHQPEGPWAIVAHVPRPTLVGESAWMSALLAANTYITLAQDAAFALDKEGDGVLVMRIPMEHAEDPLLFSTDLFGVLTAALNLRNMTQPAASSAGVEQASAPAQEPKVDFDVAATLAVPASMAELVCEARAFLGLEKVSALRSKGVDQLRIKDREVSVACDLTAHVLVMSADLGADALGTTERCRAALLANSELLLLMGLSVAAAAGDCQLLGRFHAAGASGSLLAHWLEGFAAIATSLRADYRAESSAQENSKKLTT